MPLTLSVVTLRQLLDEVAAGAYAVRRRVPRQQLQKLWTALTHFVSSALSRRKGVLIPSLGTFYVLTASLPRERVKAAFELLDRRFSVISQDVSHLNRFSKKSGVSNVNYQHIGQALHLHRSCCQRLIKNITERLAMHINAGSHIEIAFPGVGVLLKNKAGRIQFKFEEDLFDRSEISMEPTKFKEKEERHVLSSPKRPESCPISPRDNPNSPEIAHDNPPVAPVECSASGQLLCNELDVMWKLCKQSDRDQSGSVEKHCFEKWLQMHCRALLRRVDGLTLLDLLQTHTTDRQATAVYYAQFLASLKELSYRQDNTADDDVAVDDDESRSSDGDHPTREEEEEDDAGTSYFLQNRRRSCSRRDCDDFNDFHFRRLSQSRGIEDVAPKVGEEPRTIEEANLLDCPSPRRIRTAPARQDRSASPSPQKRNYSKTDPRHLSDVWQLQLEEKAKLMEEFRSAESKWPYGPVHRPHIRIPATAPRYVNAHYVRPYDAPNYLHRNNIDSYWTVL